MTTTSPTRRRPAAIPSTRIAAAVVLLGAWFALWGEATLANLLSGVVIVVVIDRTVVGGRSSTSIRLVPLLRFAALVGRDAVLSTISVSAEVLTPADRTAESIVAVDLPSGPRHQLLLIIAITVTPGTAVVDVDDETGTFYLHILHDDRRAATEANVRRLAELAVEAFGTEREVAT